MNPGLEEIRLDLALSWTELDLRGHNSGHNPLFQAHFWSNENQPESRVRSGFEEARPAEFEPATNRSVLFDLHSSFKPR